MQNWTTKSMWRYHFILIASVCLIGGCREEPDTENFGEVIYRLPDVPDENGSETEEGTK